MKVKLDASKIVENFPATRYMGSKRKILPLIQQVFDEIEFETCLDAFAGSGIVGYYLKKIGKEVYSNDFMSFPYFYALATIENKEHKLSPKQLKQLLQKNPNSQTFIQETFKGLYFSDDENAFLDNIRTNIDNLPNKYLKAIALSSLVRACLKKRPRGVFTYTGAKYDDGRLDLIKSLEEHFVENVNLFNNAVFDNGRINKAYCSDIFSLKIKPDLVYLDPPYFSVKSDNDYTRRYHFIEGLVKNWEGLVIQENTKTKKFKKYITPFDSKQTVYKAFEDMIYNYRKSIIAISYSSNSLPSKEDILDMLKKHKKEVKVFELDYLYSFGNQSNKVGDNANRVKEYLFIGK